MLHGLSSYSCDRVLHSNERNLFMNAGNERPLVRLGDTFIVDIDDIETIHCSVCVFARDRLVQGTG